MHLTNKLALGMVSDAPLVTFLKEHPHIQKIRFCLDNDEPRREASEQLCQKYYAMRYQVFDSPPPACYKDYNEWLVAEKQTDLSEEVASSKNDEKMNSYGKRCH